MRFWKMNGAGNDFIILNNLEEQLPVSVFPGLAKTLCTPHLSLGADGFMVVDKADDPKADFKMLFYNSDGSVGEMYGNGARCICRYGYETGLSKETQVVETTAGLVTGKRITKREYQVRLNDPTVIRLEESVTHIAHLHGNQPQQPQHQNKRDLVLLHPFQIRLHNTN